MSKFVKESLSVADPKEPSQPPDVGIDDILLWVQHPVLLRYCSTTYRSRPIQSSLLQQRKFSATKYRKGPGRLHILLFYIIGISPLALFSIPIQACGDSYGRLP